MTFQLSSLSDGRKAAFCSDGPPEWPMLGWRCGRRRTLHSRVYTLPDQRGNDGRSTRGVPEPRSASRPSVSCRRLSSSSHKDTRPLTFVEQRPLEPRELYMQSHLRHVWAARCGQPDHHSCKGPKCGSPAAQKSGPRRADIHRSWATSLHECGTTTSVVGRKCRPATAARCSRPHATSGASRGIALLWTIAARGWGQQLGQPVSHDTRAVVK